MNQAQALAVVAECGLPEEKVADLYDDNEPLREALAVLMPGYEYPDISYLTLAQVQRRCQASA